MEDNENKKIKNKHVLYMRTRGVSADSVTAFFYLFVYVCKGMFFKIKAKFKDSKENAKDQ